LKKSEESKIEEEGTRTESVAKLRSKKNSSHSLPLLFGQFIRMIARPPVFPPGFFLPEIIAYHAPAYYDVIPHADRFAVPHPHEFAVPA
jgi:hypothetical protein